jgi:hypothetical protein
MFIGEAELPRGDKLPFNEAELRKLQIEVFWV